MEEVSGLHNEKEYKLGILTQEEINRLLDSIEYKYDEFEETEEKNDKDISTKNPI